MKPLAHSNDPAPVIQKQTSEYLVAVIGQAQMQKTSYLLQSAQDPPGTLFNRQPLHRQHHRYSLLHIVKRRWF